VAEGRSKIQDAVLAEIENAIRPEVEYLGSAARQLFKHGDLS
jgi:hypothetical protein